MSTPVPNLLPCLVCGEETSLVCAVCLKTHFCSRPCAAKAWAGHRATCAEFSVLPALPDEALEPLPPAVPLESMEPATGSEASAPAFAGSGFSCAVCGSSNAAVCARCRLVGYCVAEHQRKDWPTHKAVCRIGETRVVPVQTWEQRMLAEANAAAPASLAATAAQPPIPWWDIEHDGVPPAKIIRAWKTAAASGHSRAQNNLGVCSAYGLGVTQDNTAAVAWYAKAAAQGDKDAQHNLCLRYESGSGVARDFKASAMWCARAAAQGHASAQCRLGSFYGEGVGVAQDFKASAAWLAKAAEQGYADAQNNLGVYYANGRGVALDVKAALAWCLKAAAQGSGDGQFNVGLLCEKSSSTRKDFLAAAAWYSKAAASGYAGAPARYVACIASAAIASRR
jgi:TPR repeat protein